MPSPEKPEMKRFNESARCPKCGGEKVGAMFHKNKWACHNRWRAVAVTFEGEHVHRTCARCGHEWCELPLDVSD